MCTVSYSFYNRNKSKLLRKKKENLTWSDRSKNKKYKYNANTIKTQNTSTKVIQSCKTYENVLKTSTSPLKASAIFFLMSSLGGSSKFPPSIPTYARSSLFLSGTGVLLRTRCAADCQYQTKWIRCCI